MEGSGKMLGLAKSWPEPGRMDGTEAWGTTEGAKSEKMGPAGPGVSAWVPYSDL